MTKLPLSSALVETYLSERRTLYRTQILYPTKHKIKPKKMSYYLFVGRAIGPGPAREEKNAFVPGGLYITALGARLE